MQPLPTLDVRRPRTRVGRLLGRPAIAAALVAAGTLAVAGGTADAQPRNPCADVAHRAQQHLDIAHGWWVVGMTYYNLGYDELATGMFDTAQYFTDAYELYVNDLADMGC